MDYQIAAAADGGKVLLRGRLTFEFNETFRKIVDEVMALGCRTVSVDVSRLDFIDSAGLGLLLVLREAAEQAGVRLVLCRPHGQVRRLLMISRFDKLVPVSEWGEA